MTDRFKRNSCRAFIALTCVGIACGLIWAVLITEGMMEAGFLATSAKYIACGILLGSLMADLAVMRGALAAIPKKKKPVKLPRAQLL